MQKRFLDIHRSSVTVLLVGQNVSLALHSAQRAYVQSSGRLEIEGPRANFCTATGSGGPVSRSDPAS